MDLVGDTSGLASFIKNASSSDLKFLLVGIGQNVSSLLSDHQSIERLVVPVQVPVMTEAELIQIIDRAMVRLAELNLQYSFNRSSSRILARLASGFPWFIHVLGQEALLAAHRADRTTVTADDAVFAAKSLLEHRLAHRFRDMYQTAVGESWKREMVLRTFARYPNEDIPTDDMYRVLRPLVASPWSYVGHLSHKSYGNIFLRPLSQKRGILRFANEMFKVYVRVRDPIFDVDGRIRHAWRDVFAGTPFADDAEPIVPE